MSLGVCTNTIGALERTGVPFHSQTTASGWIAQQAEQGPLESGERTRPLPVRSRRPRLLPDTDAAAAIFNANIRAAWRLPTRELYAYLRAHGQSYHVGNKRAVALFAADLATFGMLPLCRVCGGKDLVPDPYRRLLTCWGRRVRGVHEGCASESPTYEDAAATRSPAAPLPAGRPMAPNETRRHARGGEVLLLMMCPVESRPPDLAEGAQRVVDENPDLRHLFEGLLRSPAVSEEVAAA